MNENNTDFKEAQINYLIETLAKLEVTYNFALIHTSIYGSQIALLKRINESKRIVQEEFIIAYFNDVRKAYPQVYIEWDSGRYIDFLISHELVKYENYHYFITDKGIEFLTWITITGQLENKPY